MTRRRKALPEPTDVDVLVRARSHRAGDVLDVLAQVEADVELAGLDEKSTSLRIEERCWTRMLPGELARRRPGHAEPPGGR